MKKLKLFLIHGCFFGAIACLNFSAYAGNSGYFGFDFHNQTGKSITATCTPSAHYSVCGPNQFKVKNIVNTMKSYVVLKNNKKQSACVVEVEDEAHCSHGGCAYEAVPIQANAGLGYHCNILSQSLVNLSESN